MDEKNNYTFKDSVLKMYELMGLGSIVLEYPELPGLEVTLTIDEKEISDDV